MSRRGAPWVIENGGASRRTYTRMRGSLRAFGEDALRMYRTRTRNMAGDISATRRQVDHVAAVYRDLAGGALADRDVLIVGAGQTPREVHGFGMRNRVTAIDLDVIPNGWKPGPYLELLRANGPTRAAKTVGRKLLGIDRKIRRGLAAELGGEPSPARYLQMDAGAMTFPDAQFDLVYSHSVFEHLPDPQRALREMVRVLRPGGVLYVSIHIYSAEGGCHDLRIFAGEREGIPYWAHLRPEHKHTVVESCYMNEWRVESWTELFERECPGAAISRETHHEEFNALLEAELATLRAAGELGAYDDDELLTVNYRAAWAKPADALPAGALSGTR